MIQLRPFQRQALETLGILPSSPSKLPGAQIKDKHLLCIAPTGSGKSLIYEFASLSPDRRTLLVTPLVALARQQYSKLQKLGIPSSLGAGGGGTAPPAGRSGAWIISPEILQNQNRQILLQQWQANFLVVDECHCLWEWGEHFRPAFSLVPELLKRYSIPKSIWLTATLPLHAKEDLRARIGFPLEEMGKFDLPKGLFLKIQQSSLRNRTEALLEWALPKKPGGIIFVPTREATYRLGRVFNSLGKSIQIYHGGLSQEEKRNIERQILNCIPEIVIATSAFGMGMDYPHLKFVVVWQAPTSILSLVQIIGRVGRIQGIRGDALVLWDEPDFQMLEWTVQASERRRNELIQLLTFLSTQKCRRIALQTYFDGNHSGDPCLQCDYCIDI